ncbi:MAG: hypothetical protein LHV69_09265, partial [Elusimicrobia bacterium]|nr:hypothetical protein [Candidatus Obscuribacterium magneticum]
MIVVLLTSQTVLGSVAESNIWKDRRAALTSKNSTQASPVLASLPAGMGPAGSLHSQSLLNQLPTVSGSLHNQPKWGDTNSRKFGTLSKKFQNLVESIPLIYGNIQDVYDAGNDAQPAVVLLQDIHMNPEAQTNIASLLQELIDQKQVGLVGVEGAFTSFDFAPFRAFTDKQITKDVTQSFLDNNLLAAPSYVGITSLVEPPPFVGVDDKEHYDANVKAYLDSRKNKDSILKQVSVTKRDLAAEKEKAFSPELKRFDDLRSAQLKGDIGFGLYVKKLASYGVGSDFAVDQFLEAFDMESALDFNRVEKERKGVIERLAKGLKEKELSQLLNQSLAYRTGRIGFGDYYQGLKNLCEEKGISLAATPAFESYIRYVLLSDGIKADRLFTSVQKMEEDILKNLVSTPEEKRLMDHSHYLSLVEKLTDFALTPTEWATYEKITNDELRITNKAESSNRKSSFVIRNLSSFDSFYTEAEFRSQKMVENLTNSSLHQKKQSPLPSGEGQGEGINARLPLRPLTPAPPAENATPLELRSRRAGLSRWEREPRIKKEGNTVLVTGGFHTPEVAALLRAQKTSYVIVSPKITKLDDASGTSYLSVFAREKTPLDRLFAGEKLFVTPDVGHIAKPQTNFRLMSSLTARITQVADFVIKIGPRLIRAHVNILDKADASKDDVQVKLSWKEKLYLTLGVQWEVVFPLLIPLMMHFLESVPFIGVIALVVSALLFALPHPNRTKTHVAIIIGVGLVLGSPFLLPGLSVVQATTLSMVLHLIYEATILIGRWQTRFKLWRQLAFKAPLASIFINPSPNINDPHFSQLGFYSYLKGLIAELAKPILLIILTLLAPLFYPLYSVNPQSFPKKPMVPNWGQSQITFDPFQWHDGFPGQALAPAKRVKWGASMRRWIQRLLIPALLVLVLSSIRSPVFSPSSMPPSHLPVATTPVLPQDLPENGLERVTPEKPYPGDTKQILDPHSIPEAANKPSSIRPIDEVKDFNSQGVMGRKELGGSNDLRPSAFDAGDEVVVGKVTGKVMTPLFNSLQFNFRADGLMESPVDLIHSPRGRPTGENSKFTYRVEVNGRGSFSPLTYMRGIIEKEAILVFPVDAEGKRTGPNIDFEYKGGRIILDFHGRVQIEVNVTNYDSNVTFHYTAQSLPSNELRDFPDAFALEIIQTVISSLSNGSDLKSRLSGNGSFQDKLDAIAQSDEVSRSVKIQAAANVLSRHTAYNGSYARWAHDGISLGSTWSGILSNGSRIRVVCANSATMFAYVCQRLGLRAGYMPIDNYSVKGDALVRGNIPHALAVVETDNGWEWVETTELMPLEAGIIEGKGGAKFLDPGTSSIEGIKKLVVRPTNGPQTIDDSPEVQGASNNTSSPVDEDQVTVAAPSSESSAEPNVLSRTGMWFRSIWSVIEQPIPYLWGGLGLILILPLVVLRFVLPLVTKSGHNGSPSNDSISKIFIPFDKKLPQYPKEQIINNPDEYVKTLSDQELNFFAENGFGKIKEAAKREIERRANGKNGGMNKGVLWTPKFIAEKFGRVGTLVWENVVAPLWEEGAFTWFALTVSVLTGSFWYYAILRFLFVVGHLIQQPREPGASLAKSFLQRFTLKNLTERLTIPILISILVSAAIHYTTGFDAQSLDFAHRALVAGIAVGIHFFISTVITPVINGILHRLGIPLALRKGNLVGASNEEEFLRNLTKRIVRGLHWEETGELILQEEILRSIQFNRAGKTIGELIRQLCDRHKLAPAMMASNFPEDVLGMAAGEQVLRAEAMKLADRLYRQQQSKTPSSPSSNSRPVDDFSARISPGVDQSQVSNINQRLEEIFQRNAYGYNSLATHRIHRALFSAIILAKDGTDVVDILRTSAGELGIRASWDEPVLNNLKVNTQLRTTLIPKWRQLSSEIDAQEEVERATAEARREDLTARWVTIAKVINGQTLQHQKTKSYLHAPGLVISYTDVFRTLGEIMAASKEGDVLDVLVKNAARLGVTEEFLRSDPQIRRATLGMPLDNIFSLIGMLDVIRQLADTESTRGLSFAWAVTEVDGVAAWMVENSYHKVQRDTIYQLLSAATEGERIVDVLRRNLGRLGIEGDTFSFWLSLPGVDTTLFRPISSLMKEAANGRLGRPTGQRQRIDFGNQRNGNAVDMGKGVLWTPRFIAKKFGRAGVLVWENVVVPVWEEGAFTWLALTVSVLTGSFWYYAILRFLFVVGHLIQQPREPGVSRWWSLINRFTLKNLTERLTIPILISILVSAAIHFTTGFDVQSLDFTHRLLVAAMAVGIHFFINTVITPAINWVLHRLGINLTLRKGAILSSEQISANLRAVDGLHWSGMPVRIFSETGEYLCELTYSEARKAADEGVINRPDSMSYEFLLVKGKEGELDAIRGTKGGPAAVTLSPSIQATLKRIDELGAASQPVVVFNEMGIGMGDLTHALARQAGTEGIIVVDKDGGIILVQGKRSQFYELKSRAVDAELNTMSAGNGVPTAKPQATDKAGDRARALALLEKNRGLFPSVINLFDGNPSYELPLSYDEVRRGVEAGVIVMSPTRNWLCFAEGKGKKDIPSKSAPMADSPPSAAQAEADRIKAERAEKLRSELVAKAKGIIERYETLIIENYIFNKSKIQPDLENLMREIDRSGVEDTDLLGWRQRAEELLAARDEIEALRAQVLSPVTALSDGVSEVRYRWRNPYAAAQRLVELQQSIPAVKSLLDSLASQARPSKAVLNRARVFMIERGRIKLSEIEEEMNSLARMIADEKNLLDPNASESNRTDDILNRLASEDINGVRHTQPFEKEDLPGGLARRISIEDWYRVENLIYHLAKSIQLRASPSYNRAEYISKTLQMILEWDAQTPRMQALLIWHLWNVRGWNRTPQGIQVLKDLKGPHPDVYQELGHILAHPPTPAYSADWVRRFFRVYHHVFYLSIDAIDTQGKEGLILFGRVRRFIPVDFPNLPHRISHVDPIYTNMAGGFYHSGNDDEAMVLEDGTEADRRLVGLHEDQHLLDVAWFQKKGIPVRSWELEYLAYLRTAEKVGEWLEEGGNGSIWDLFGQIFGGEKFMEHYMKLEGDPEAHRDATKLLLRQLVGELLNGSRDRYMTMTPEAAGKMDMEPLRVYINIIRNTVSGKAIAQKSRELLERFYVSKIGQVPSYLNLDITKIDPVSIVPPDGSLTDWTKRNDNKELRDLLLGKIRSGGQRAFNVLQVLNDKLFAAKENAKAWKKGFLTVLYALTHPITAAFTETAVIRVALELGKTVVGVTAFADPTGLSLTAFGFIAGIGFIFSLSHQDLWAESTYLGGRTPGKFLFRLGTRTVGGAVFTGLLLLPGGFFWSLTPHLVLNVLSWWGEDRAMRIEAGRVRRLVLALSKGDVAGAIALFPEERVSVEDLGARAGAEKHQALIGQLDVLTQNPKFMALLQKEFSQLPDDFEWTDANQELLEDALGAIGLDQKGALRIKTLLQSQTKRVLVIDQELHNQFRNDHDRNAFVSAALNKAGASQGKSVGLVVSEGLQDYYQHLARELRVRAGVKAYPASMIKDRKLDPLILTLISQIALGDMFLVVP